MPSQLRNMLPAFKKMALIIPTLLCMAAPAEAASSATTRVSVTILTATTIGYAPENAEPAPAELQKSKASFSIRARQKQACRNEKCGVEPGRDFRVIGEPGTYFSITLPESLAIVRQRTGAAAPLQADIGQHSQAVVIGKDGTAVMRLQSVESSGELQGEAGGAPSGPIQIAYD